VVKIYEGEKRRRMTKERIKAGRIVRGA